MNASGEMLAKFGSRAVGARAQAAEALDALRSKLRQEVSVLRDGHAKAIEIGELVPGDVVALRGGQAVPADGFWVSGDVVKVDTAALTGEPIPRAVPRTSKKDPERAERTSNQDDADRRLLGGCVVVQGECQCLITETGVRTEVGRALECVAAARTGPRPLGLFESKILAIVKAVILVTLLATAVVFYVQRWVRGEPYASRAGTTSRRVVRARRRRSFFTALNVQLDISWRWAASVHPR